MVKLQYPFLDYQVLLLSVFFLSNETILIL